MKQCPKCDSPFYRHHLFLEKYKCLDCGYVETDKEKEEDIAKFKEENRKRK